MKQLKLVQMAPSEKLINESNDYVLIRSNSLGQARAQAGTRAEVVISVPRLPSQGSFL